jgi:hypothetical protein
MQLASHDGQIGGRAVDLGGLPADELADVGTRDLAGSLEGDDLLDLGQREAESPGLGHEGDEAKASSP